jgi:hypothetical protein
MTKKLMIEIKVYDNNNVYGGIPCFNKKYETGRPIKAKELKII